MTLQAAGPLNDNLPYFLPPVYYSAADYTGDIPLTAVAIADFNGDGYPDIAATAQWNYPYCWNGNGGTVEILLGNGDGTYQAPVTYCTGGVDATSVAVADMNGDGKPDLVVMNLFTHPPNDNGLVGVLLGNGDGTFRPAVGYDLGGPGGWSVVVADVNRDGKPDVVAANYDDDSIGVLLGNGDGNLEPVVRYSSGGSGGPIALAVADVNGDHKPDLVVAINSNSTVGVLLGNGDGSFQPAVAYNSGGLGPCWVAVADLNGDHKPDLVVANGGIDATYPESTDRTVGVLLGNGDGTFKAAVPYDSGGNNLMSAAVADVNGDGKPDLLLMNSGIVAVLLGNGNGTFQTALAYYSGGNAPEAAADLNGDVLPDLVDVSILGAGSVVGVMLHVGNLPTSTEVVSSPNPSVFGEAVTLTATVNSASATPTGTVGYFGNSKTLGSASLADGQAPLPVTALAVGSNSIKAVYQGSVTFKPSSSTSLNQVVTIATTSTSVTPSKSPAPINRAVTYSAYVASQYGGAATGKVVFQDGGVAVATANVGNNWAGFTTMYTTRGVHAITGTYSGDSNNLGSTSATLMEQVSGFATQTTLTSSGSPSYVGQPVTFSASVTSARGAIPNGELVTFYDGTIAMASVPLAGGVAAYTTSSLTGGKTHYIMAKYVGDSTLEPSKRQVQQLVQRYSTTTTLSASPNPSSYGQAVTWTATVTSTGPIKPTGTVVFAGASGRVTLNGGTATYVQRWLQAGTHAITAKYIGDAASAPSASTGLNQVVNPVSTTTTLTSSANPSSRGQAVTFTAKVKSATGASPVGTVTFTAGSTVLGTVTIGNSPTSISVNTLPAGSSVVTATYNGVLDFAGSSGKITQTVNP
ncbi:MAG TPA: Ig-like domain repeat protein [Candidatus Sulfotelmatobacter sp.]|nr:Ig-like domain repeat protein [Candidatus Sulfotelmatobacter sp.]